MLTTSTHDTKRSEDVRARIDLLSEIPLAWRRRVRRWRDMNASKKRVVEGMEAPTRNDEYLLYQTLVGAWPPDKDRPAPEFTARIQQYMLKAVREAKEKTSWANQNAEYEAAVADFVAKLLDQSESEKFLLEFIPFQRRIAHFGLLNSLSQNLLKLTAPGVPDIYQGQELWDFSLVDPDNRRQVDYARGQATLRELQTRSECSRQISNFFSADLAGNMVDGRIKLYLIWKTLGFRNKNQELFAQGNYVELPAEGTHAAHVVAFARQLGNDAVVVVVPRLAAKLAGIDATFPIDSSVWKDTRVSLAALPELESFTNVFTGEQIRPDSDSLRLSMLLANFPLALFSATLK